MGAMAMIAKSLRTMGKVEAHLCHVFQNWGGYVVWYLQHSSSGVQFAVAWDWQ